MTLGLIGVLFVTGDRREVDRSAQVAMPALETQPVALLGRCPGAAGSLGRVVASTNCIRWELGIRGFDPVEAVVHGDGFLYVLAGQRVRVVDVRNGQLNSVADLPEQPAAAVAAVEGQLAVGFQSGAVIALNSDGSQAWMRSPARPSDGPNRANRMVGDGRGLVVFEGATAVSLDGRGEAEWSVDLPTPPTRVALDELHVYVADGRRFLSAMARDDGETVWSIRAAGSEIVDLAVAGGHVLVLDEDGGVYAVERRTGRQAWRTTVEPWVEELRLGDRLVVAGWRVLDSRTGLDRRITLADDHSLDTGAAAHPYLGDGHGIIDAPRELPVVAILEGDVFAAGSGGEVFRIAEQTPRELVFQSAEGGVVQPIVVAGRLYVLVGSDRRALLALDLPTA